MAKKGDKSDTATKPDKADKPGKADTKDSDSSSTSTRHSKDKGDNDASANKVKPKTGSDGAGAAKGSDAKSASHSPSGSGSGGGGDEGVATVRLNHRVPPRLLPPQGRGGSCVTGRSTAPRGTTGATPPRLQAFANGDGGDDQTRDGICPRPPHE